jgi:hypothetical protein
VAHEILGNLIAWQSLRPVQASASASGKRSVNGLLCRVTSRSWQLHLNLFRVKFRYHEPRFPPLKPMALAFFNREAGPADEPVVLLLHGFPSSSHMFRELIPRLATRYPVIAPDLPSFGFTRVPEERDYKYRSMPLCAR